MVKWREELSFMLWHQGDMKFFCNGGALTILGCMRMSQCFFFNQWKSVVSNSVVLDPTGFNYVDKKGWNIQNTFFCVPQKKRKKKGKKKIHTGIKKVNNYESHFWVDYSGYWVNYDFHAKWKLSRSHIVLVCCSSAFWITLFDWNVGAERTGRGRRKRKMGQCVHLIFFSQEWRNRHEANSNPQTDVESSHLFQS